ncbi:hypothetical protein HPB50_003884 [Hyalomma asiaticum]|uniref:Uncharacterized protein n=1 Tax=Hyalomma asiaticum TaxID=266040 RepID=A0ACB7RSA6_HYAAI|nr:hypothetical protein HPB50_003884 [Hyalomma asiaticum]
MERDEPLYGRRPYTLDEDEPEYGEVAYATVVPRRRAGSALRRFVLSTFRPARSSPERSESPMCEVSCVVEPARYIRC